MADGGSRDRDRIADPWGRRTPYGAGQAWPVRVDQQVGGGRDGGEVEAERWVPSACVLCSNGCGLDIGVAGGRIVGVRGRAGDRVNHGRLGPKGLYGWQANGAADRLLRPLVRDGGELVETGWDQAMERIVERSRALLEAKGGGAFGFYTSSQLFSEEYYTLGVIGKGGLGTPHMDGNTRLCTATAGQALKESFGCDGQPASYTDVDAADTLFLVGHNVAATQTVLWSRMLDRRRGPDPPALVVVDPRATVPAREADLHLAVRGGTNLALLNALQHELFMGGHVDRDWVAAHALGIEELERTWPTGRRSGRPRSAASPPPRSGRRPGSWAPPSGCCPPSSRASTSPTRPPRPPARSTTLVTWDDPESAFEAWKACSRGRPCDYSGLGYDRLRDAGGIQWPVTETAPDGTERLYADGRFPTDPEVCEDYGHDLATGAEQSPEEYRAKRPGGRAFLRAADYQPGPEQPDDDFPLLLTTGRTVYHFHTRTKTGRAPELQEAAPEAWVELSAADADRLGVADGDLVRVESRRGAVEVACRITGIAHGMVFVPFRYARQAANELTLTAWDPVSKQPLYKTAAVRLSREG